MGLRTDMGASRNPLLAELKKTFAKAHGLCERTARRHFNGNSELWQTFVAKQGSEAARNLAAARVSTVGQAAALEVLGPGMPNERPPVVDEPDERLTEPARILKQHWLIWKHASGAWSAAIVEGDEMKALALGQATIKAQEAFYKAKQRHGQWELDDRRKIPVDEFHAFRSGFVLPLANLLRNLPGQLGPLMNPKDSGHAIRAGTDYMITVVQPQIERLLNALDEHAPPAAAMAA